MIYRENRDLIKIGQQCQALHWKTEVRLHCFLKNEETKPIRSGFLARLSREGRLLHLSYLSVPSSVSVRIYHDGSYW